MSRRNSVAPSGKEDVPAPCMVEDYNAHMGYVDAHGMRIRSYETNRTSKSWWRCVFFWLLDCACFNAYLLYLHQPFNLYEQRLHYRDWLARLASELIAGKIFRHRQKKRKLAKGNSLGKMDFGHAQLQQEGRKRCNTGCGRFTTLKCWKCEIWICRKCWFEKRSHLRT